MTALETTPVAAGRPAGEVLAWSRTALDPALRAAVDSLPGSMRRVCAYHFGWTDEHGRPIAADAGKALRPALALLSAAAVGGLPDRAVPAAVAVELVHNFSLLHDDVMDGDVTRRHRPTAWTVFGRDEAILAGDSLLALAFQVLAEAGPPGPGAPYGIGICMVNATVQRLLDGQSADLAFESRESVGLAEVRAMAENKTGALLGCACALGAWFGHGSPAQVAALRAFGELLGLAFQQVDDLLGIWGDPAVTGKPVHSDLASRKKSFPVVAAMSSGTPAGDELSLKYGHEDDLAVLAGLIETAGGRAFGQSAADDLLGRALGHLDTARPHGPAAAELRALAAFATRREK
ncbi:dimethylallyltransferase [Virgisporangium aliadipatigenens]|uniref:Dimethylallyltransferase n=1 Tax=Virgisporangium aliadipatigenens TaxID=741659 RepID=A0A8J4DNW8_9ACTN|nr:family 2 encapsulin nanocompartment cargo protein polyprenyl transferase [Virgisporangium aliadipatigenens]GIJ44889.1 dimethylallyltransferase [Virgisporangium aliadipatigenens]